MVLQDPSSNQAAKFIAKSNHAFQAYMPRTGDHTIWLLSIVPAKVRWVLLKTFVGVFLISWCMHNMPWRRKDGVSIIEVCLHLLTNMSSSCLCSCGLDGSFSVQHSLVVFPTLSWGWSLFFPSGEPLMPSSYELPLSYYMHSDSFWCESA